MRTIDGREYVISEDGTVYLQDEDKRGFTAATEPVNIPLGKIDQQCLLQAEIEYLENLLRISCNENQRLRLEIAHLRNEMPLEEGDMWR